LLLFVFIRFCFQNSKNGCKNVLKCRERALKRHIQQNNIQPVRACAQFYD
jgi:hypothetical protein